MRRAISPSLKLRSMSSYRFILPEPTNSRETAFSESVLNAKESDPATPGLATLARVPLTPLVK
jgi:hypothetical protein